LTGYGVFPYRAKMDSELSALEAKVQQAVSQLKQLREDGRELRQQLATRTDENARLTEKLAAAKARIEALLRQIPEAEA
jgi:cell division protein ZapB